MSQITEVKSKGSDVTFVHFSYHLLTGCVWLFGIYELSKVNEKFPTYLNDILQSFPFNVPLSYKYKTPLPGLREPRKAKVIMEPW